MSLPDNCNLFSVGLVGNPNCGKTTLFNGLTGSKQQVGNWPGVTVEQKTGQYLFNDDRFTIVDLPGTYSIDVPNDDVSLDERIARDYVVSGKADLIVNIVDASNLERNLYLTTQLLDTQVPMIVALNMIDVAEKNQVAIDVDKLSKQLKCPVIPVVASRKQGIDHLKQIIANAMTSPPPPGAQITYEHPVEEAIELLLNDIKDVALEAHINPRWLSVRLIEGDSLALDIAGETTKVNRPNIILALEEQLSEDLDTAIADARYSFIHRVAQQCTRRTDRITRSLTDRIDHFALHPLLGMPIFLLIMYLMFMLTINVGGAFIDFFDLLFGAFLVDGLSVFLTNLGAPEWLILVLADGIGGGIQVVATFIPIIAFLFISLSFLEGTGYMARAAFVMDRLMRLIGLPGKAFVPLLIGFGCNVPSVMASRTLKHERDRLLTVLLSPFMSCGARLPIYAFFTVAFFPDNGQNIIFLLYIIGIIAAVFTGMFMKKSLFPGESSAFLMELPNYHIPTIRNIATHTWQRLKDFLFGAGQIIVPMVLVLNLLNAVTLDGEFDREGAQNSVLSVLGKAITPIFHPLGINDDNWAASVGIFTGLLAKEATVGTLDALYTQEARHALPSSDIKETPFNLGESVGEAFNSVGENLKGVIGLAGDPLAIGETLAEENAFSKLTMDAVRGHFDDSKGAFAYMLFILLYMPCAAVLGAIYRENGIRWAIFVGSWTTALAWSSSTFYYQIATYSYHPTQSLMWIIMIPLGYLVSFFVIRSYGKRHHPHLTEKLP